MNSPAKEHYRQVALQALGDADKAKRQHGRGSRQHREALERYEMARSTMNRVR